MNAKEGSVRRIGLAISGALALIATGCTTHVHQRTVYVPPPVIVTPPPPEVVTPLPSPQPPPVVAVPPSSPPPPVVVVPPAAPAPIVVIQSERDFYEPLSPYGRWVVVPGYGYSWVPARIEADWHPYSDGYWQRTDAGWYWMSEEPWGWATYHYGRWDWNVQFGWFWVPQTQWAPAWVAWREGGGYIGWAPLRPSVAVGVSLTSVNYEPAFASRAFVFVEHRRMMERVRPTTVVVNNTTIINKTINITKVNVVNKTVINEGPRPDVVERESGRKIHTVPVRDFRDREERAVAERNRNVTRNEVQKTRSPEHAQVETRTSAHVPHRERPLPPVATVTPPAAASPQAKNDSPRELPKRDERVRRDNRELETPSTEQEANRSTSAKPKDESPALQSRPSRPTANPVPTHSGQVPPITRPVQADVGQHTERATPRQNAQQITPNVVAKSGTKDVKELGQAHPRQRPNVSEATGQPEDSGSRRTQMSPREKSRSTDRAEGQPDSKDNGRDKAER